MLRKCFIIKFFECPQCKGTGILEILGKKEECVICQGTGEIKDEKELNIDELKKLLW